MGSVLLGTKAVGSTVKLKVDGMSTNFLVVHQGLPDSDIYDASCDGTWLLMQDCCETMMYGGTNNYKSSEHNSYLNGTWINKLDSEIRAKVKTVKIPYFYYGGANNAVVKKGSDGVECRSFLLSHGEVEYYSDKSSADAPLDYFKNSASDKNKLIAYVDGKAVSWALRTPTVGGNYVNGELVSRDSTNFLEVVSTSGSIGMGRCTGSYGIRPAMVLPKDLYVSDDGAVTTNAPPTTPSGIIIPGTIHGGKGITISWTASSDEQNNLEGYMVEKSTDGGSTWTQIYQGSATSTTNTVAFGTESVMYRVRAYDSEGLTSGYRNSAQISVINNTAPTAPGSITVPETVFGGGTVEISWTASGDSEGNLAGYALERRVDEGAWTEIFRGDALSFADTVTKGWTSAAWRVRAYDSENAYSGYTASEVRVVDNNAPPAITCALPSGSSLGVKSEGFAVEYAVSDEDGDTITVTEAVDGVTLRTFTEDTGQGHTLEVVGETFMKLLNGHHAVDITAGDGKAAAVHKLSFVKSVTSARISLEQPMAADAPISVCVLSVSGAIPLDALFRVEVTNNGLDDEPVWEDCTSAVKFGSNYIFQNETAENGPAFNFRVTAERGDSGLGGYITSVQGGFQ